MYDEMIELAQPQKKISKYGDIEENYVTKTVFANTESVGRNEFYQASAAGFKTEIKFKLADYMDYDGQPVVIYNGQTYNVIRTYRAGIELEIICSRGVENGSS